MKILKIDNKLNEITVLTESLDDLWHLEKVVDTGDIVFGKTDRKIKPSKEGEKTIRQTIFVELNVENASFQEFSENLKIGGVIIGGKPTEFIELKAHQSIDVGIGDKVKFRKKQLKQWQIERLKKAEKESASAKLLVVLMDDESAELAFINQFSIDKKAKIVSGKQGKRFEEKKSDYFEKIIGKIVLLKPNKILLAGPGFTKDNFKKSLEEKSLKTPIFVEIVNSIGETGFRELISQGKLDKVEKEIQLTKEAQLIEELVESLPKNKAEYGINEVSEAITNGLVAKVIVSETFLMQNREKIENVMDLAEKMKCEIHIISSKNPQEKTIYNFGGITAILHYRKK
jgi:protein pelota